jgi:hypothetical protein
MRQFDHKKHMAVTVNVTRKAWHRLWSCSSGFVFLLLLSWQLVPHWWVTPPPPGLLLSAHLALQLLLGALQVFYEQVLACELVVIGVVVDALPVIKVDAVQLMMDPPAAPWH